MPTVATVQCVQARRVGESWRSGLMERPLGWEDGRAQKWRSTVADPRIDSCLQAAFLTFGGMAFAAGFGASLAFSFAANSCLTLRLMASTSTL